MFLLRNQMTQPLSALDFFCLFTIYHKCSCQAILIKYQRNMTSLWVMYWYYYAYVIGEKTKDREVMYPAQDHTASNSIDQHFNLGSLSPDASPLCTFSVFIKIHQFSEPILRTFFKSPWGQKIFIIMLNVICHFLLLYSQK